MFELFIAALGISLLLLFLLMNSQRVVSRLFGKVLTRDTKRKRYRVYMEHFRENKQKSSGSSIVIQILPWLGVLAFVFVLGNQYVYFGTVLSGSMQPLFKKGDLVLMQTVDKEPNIGDIIMFSVGGSKEPITHRIVRMTPEGGIITKGDNNPIEDSWVLMKRNIMGKAVTIGGEPVALKGLGPALVPEAGDFTIMRRLSKDMGTLMLFQQFRALQPIILLFATIFYFFVLMETRVEESRRFRRK